MVCFKSKQSVGFLQPGSFGREENGVPVQDKAQTYELWVGENLAGGERVLLRRLVRVFAGDLAEAGHAAGERTLLQRHQVAAVQAVHRAPAHAPVEVVHGLALRRHSRPGVSARWPTRCLRHTWASTKSPTLGLYSEQLSGKNFHMTSKIHWVKKKKNCSELTATCSHFQGESQFLR